MYKEQRKSSDRRSLTRPKALLRFGVLTVVASLSACASMPDAQINYYYAQSRVSFKVMRSVVCDANGYPLVATTVTPTVTHIADISKMHALQLSKLRGTFVDSDVKVELYDDGRLMSVNAAVTGQGESILKAATTLASLIVAFDAGTPAKTNATECAFIKEQGGGKPLSVAYEGTIDTSKLTQSQTIMPDAASAFYAQGVVSAIGEVCAVVTSVGDSGAPVLYKESQDGLVLKARQPGWAHIAVMTKKVGVCKSASPLWEGRIPVAQYGAEYLLPIPSPSLFGKQTFGVAFTESGAMKTVQYVSNSGAAQAVGGLGSLLTIAQGETTTQKSAELKAEADLIVQQQRLVQCLADPKSCK